MILLIQFSLFKSTIKKENYQNLIFGFMKTENFKIKKNYYVLFIHKDKNKNNKFKKAYKNKLENL